MRDGVRRNGTSSRSGPGRRSLTVGVVVAIATALIALVLPGGAARASTGDFYTYRGAMPLSSYAPGDVLKTRTVPYHLYGVPFALQAVQILYRTTDAMGRPSANVTSYIRPPQPLRGVVSYQSAYDSLNPDDSPSRIVEGDLKLFELTSVGKNVHIGSTFANGENLALAGVLLLGYGVNIPDTEGQKAHFAAGPEYATNTLDSLRAIERARGTGVTSTTRFGLVGYSGGSIASNWAAIRGPSYAPEINRRIVGVAQGGMLINPARNLRYVNGSLGWAGVLGMAINGIARAYDSDFTRYLNPYGKQIMRQLSDASALNFFYLGLTWQKLVKPQYANPNTVPEFVDNTNKVNMGTAPIPTVPMFIAQAANGILEGTLPGPPGIGAGDAVMITGDVRALVHRYCDAGLNIFYQQYDALSHIPAVPVWIAQTIPWLLDRFADKPAPNNCRQVPPGNPGALAPTQHAR